MRWPCCVRLYKNAALGTRSHSTRIIKTQSNTNVLDQTGPFCRVGGDELGTVSFLSGVSLAWALQEKNIQCTPAFFSEARQISWNCDECILNNMLVTNLIWNSDEIDFPYKPKSISFP